MEHSWHIRDIPFGDVKTGHGKSLHIPPIPRSTHCWSYGGVIVAVAPLMRMMSQSGNPALGDDGELSHESQAWEAAEADASAVLAGSCEDGDFFPLWTWIALINAFSIFPDWILRLSIAMFGGRWCFRKGSAMICRVGCRCLVLPQLAIIKSFQTF